MHCHNGDLCIDVGRRIGEGTAKFYLDVAEGNVRDAIALYGKTGKLPLAARTLQSPVKKCLTHACQHIGFCAGFLHIALVFCCLHSMSKMHAKLVWHCRARHGMGASTQGQAATISCL